MCPPGSEPQLSCRARTGKERAAPLCLSPSPWLAAGRQSLRPPHPEVYADGGYEGPGQEGPVFESDQETGFPDARVSQKHHLGDGGRGS